MKEFDAEEFKRLNYNKLESDNLIGNKYNRLTILKVGGLNKYGKRQVTVKCDCANSTVFDVSLYDIIKNKTQSCGCYAKEIKKINGMNNKKYNTYDLTGEYGIGYTLKGEEFYFDLEDYDKIKDYCWHKDSGYIRTTLNNKKILIHNLIMNNKGVDHIYLNKHDNRKENLRIVTPQQNSFNKKGHGKMSEFGLKGISWRKSNKKWVSYIRKENKIVYYKYFDNIQKCIENKIIAEKEYFGEYRYAWENDIKWEELIEYEKELKGK